MASPEPHVAAQARKHSRRRPVLFATLGVVLGLIAMVAIAIAIVLADANMLRKPIADYVSHKLDRSFAINGDLRIQLLPHAQFELNDVALSNASWGSRPTMVHVERALIAVELLPLLHKQIVLPRVELNRPDVLLEKDVDGEANWALGPDKHQSSNSSPPEIRSLWIKEGKLAFVDPEASTDVQLVIDSDRTAGEAESALRFSGKGTLRNEPFRLEGHAGSLLELTESGKPYKLKVTAAAGGIKASFDGSIVPLKMATIDGQLTLSGNDLSHLYPLVPVQLPWTPAYRISGHFVRDATKYSLRDLNGRVGSSDVRGIVSVDVGGARPLVNANLTSKRLDYQDLAGLLGAPPPAKGKPRPAPQQRAAQKREETGRVLPDKPYNVEGLRKLDARVKFKGESIITRDLPLDSIKADLELERGKLTLKPLDFGVAGGHITSQIAVDASRDVMQAELDATVSNLEVKQLMPRLKQSQGSAGKLGGRAKLATKGNSIAQMAASANGEIALIMSQGRASTLALVLTNLDLANATRYLLRGDPNAPVYCGVVQASLRNGKLAPDVFVVDSSEEKITGEGDIDLIDEKYQLRLVAHSKRLSIVALRGPIRIDGTFEHPQVHPETGPVALRIGAAVALGTLLTPVASLLALVDPGGAKDSNCAALIEQARSDVAKTQVAPPRQAAPPPPSAGKDTPSPNHRSTQ